MHRRMYRTLLSLAAVATAASAFAQAKNSPLEASSLTIAGTVDVGVTRGTATGAGSGRTFSTSSGNNAISKLIFRGTEDLGGGLYAGFWLESQLNADYGGAGSVNSANNQTFAPAGNGLNFARRSTLSLISRDYGELRLGRDVVPSLWNYVDFDPYSNLGVGAILMVTSPFTGLNAGPLFTLLPAGHSSGGPWARASNMIDYFTPRAWGPVYGQFGYFMGGNPQNGAANEKDGTGSTMRVGYAAGRLHVAASYTHITFKATPTSSAPGSPSGDMRSGSIGGDWDFGFARLMALVSRDEREGPRPAVGRGWNVAARVPVGVGEIKFSLGNYRIDAGPGADPHTRKVALGYVHNLSKRTALYTTVARVWNHNGARVSLGGAVIAPANGSASSSGFELGLRHNF